MRQRMRKWMNHWDNVRSYTSVGRYIQAIVAYFIYQSRQIRRSDTLTLSQNRPIHNNHASCSRPSIDIGERRYFLEDQRTKPAACPKIGTTVREGAYYKVTPQFIDFIRIGRSPSSGVWFYKVLYCSSELLKVAKRLLGYEIRRVAG